MIRSELKVQIILDCGRFLFVTEKAKEILDSIRFGKDQFVEMLCTDGFRHYVNVDHIVEAKEAKEVR